MRTNGEKPTVPGSRLIVVAPKLISTPRLTVLIRAPEGVLQSHFDAFDFDVYTVSLDAPFLDTSSWTVA